jgi:hypothetical protein
MCPHQPSNRALVHSESTTRMGPKVPSPSAQNTVEALFTQKVYRYEELLPSTPVLSEMVCAVVKAFALMTAGAEIQSMRARWLRFHVIRTLFSVPALAVYLLAVMSNTSRQ